MSVTTVSFGDFELDDHRYELRRGGTTVPLQRKPFDVLRYLLEHRDRVVTSEELMERLWAGTTVTDSSLKFCIHAIRAALGDSGIAQRFIRTLPGRGYQFAAAVAGASPGAAGPDRTEATAAARPGWWPRLVFVGRQGELERLRTLLGEARGGYGHLVLIAGEAGIGKTRLATELGVHAGAQGARVLRGGCYGRSGAPSFWPWIQVLRGLVAASDPEALRGVLGHHAPCLAALLPEIGERLPDLDPAAAVGEPERFRILDAVSHTLRRTAAQQPLLLVLEDLHWADVASLLLLEFLLRDLGDAPLLLVATYRPDEPASEPQLARILDAVRRDARTVVLTLGGLPRSAVEAMLAAGGAGTAGPLVDRLLEKTAGNPFFIQEILRHWAEAGLLGTTPAADAAAFDEAGIPGGIRDVVRRRFERTSSACQRLLGTAAVLGREFDAHDLHELWRGRWSPPVQQALEEAAAAHLVERLARAPGRYRFTHTLLRDVLYDDLGAPERVALHRAVGTLLEAQSSTRGRPVFALLAHHFCAASPGSGAEVVRKAVAYSLRAGQQAAAVHASEEAIAHYERALDALRAHPELCDHREQELNLLLALTTSLMTARGYAVPEVQAAQARAHALAGADADRSREFDTRWAAWAMHAMRAELDTARILALALVRDAGDAADPTGALVAHGALGMTLLWRGELAAAQAHLTESARAYDPVQHAALVQRYPDDPGIVARCYRAGALDFAGARDRAVREAAAALAQARSLAHPFTLAHVLSFCALLRLGRGELAAAAEHVGEALALAERHGFPHWTAFNTVLRGALLVAEGQAEAGLDAMDRGVAAWRTDGAQVMQTYFLTLQAAACLHAGRAEAGLAHVAEALAVAERTHERFCLSDLHRLQAVLQLAQAPARGRLPSAAAGPAEAALLRALAVARAQQARVAELRATVALAALWHRQGRRAEARRALSGIAERFTEGLDTADVQAALTLRARLDERSPDASPFRPRNGHKGRRATTPG